MRRLKLTLLVLLAGCAGAPLEYGEPMRWNAGEARLAGRALSTEYLETLAFDYDPGSDQLRVRLRACNSVNLVFAVVDRRDGRAGLQPLDAVSTRIECAAPHIEAAEDSWVALLRRLNHWEENVGAPRLVADKDSYVELRSEGR